MKYQQNHWGRVTHLCVGKLTIISSDNGLAPGRRQAIIWTNAGILSIGPLGTNFSEILIEIYLFSFKKMHLKLSSRKWRPSCLGLNVSNIVGVNIVSGNKGGPRHQSVSIFLWSGNKPGPRLNIKTVLSTYGDFHVKDKTAVRTSYL